MARRTPASITTLFAPRAAALTAVLTAALAGEPEAVHQARVASRRLREVLPALTVTQGRAGRALRKDVRRVTRALGAVRELDVALGYFDEAVATSAMSAAARASTRRVLQAQRAAALRQARATLTRARLQRLQARLAELSVASTGSSASSSSSSVASITAAAVKAAMAARVEGRARGARKAAMGTGVVYMPERLHAVRIAVKRLRYALEAGQEIRGVRATAQLTQLKAIQDLLGRAHDLHVLAERIHEVEVSVVQRSRATARDLAAFARALDRECRALHAAFMSRRNGLLTLSASLVTPASAPRARSVA